jgi:hypothetical protein
MDAHQKLVFEICMLLQGTGLGDGLKACATAMALGLQELDPSEQRLMRTLLDDHVTQLLKQEKPVEH